MRALLFDGGCEWQLVSWLISRWSSLYYIFGRSVVLATSRKKSSRFEDLETGDWEAPLSQCRPAGIL